jgi:hypothetical protein
MKGELGLDHFEGRSWVGWNHHVSIVLACYALVIACKMRAFPPLGHRDDAKPSGRASERRAIFSTPLRPYGPPCCDMPSDGCGRSFKQDSGRKRCAWASSMTDIFFARGELPTVVLSTSSDPCPSSMADATLLCWTVDRRCEPGAGNPHAGLCPGGGPKGPSLPGLGAPGGNPGATRYPSEKSGRLTSVTPVGPINSRAGAKARGSWRQSLTR